MNRDNLIIEAAEPGTVVLSAAKQGRRVFYIKGSGVELIGLNITGGQPLSTPGGQISVRLPASSAFHVPHRK